MDDRLAQLRREYQELERQAEQAQRAADRAEAALEQLLAQVKEQFGVGSLAELERRCMAEEAKLPALIAAAERALAAAQKCDGGEVQRG